MNETLPLYLKINQKACRFLCLLTFIIICAYFIVIDVVIYSLSLLLQLYYSLIVWY